MIESLLNQSSEWRLVFWHTKLLRPSYMNNTYVKGNCGGRKLAYKGTTFCSDLSTLLAIAVTKKTFPQNWDAEHNVVEYELNLSILS